MLATPPSTVPYYYGHITRENAELILWDRGCLDGMYLLRASHNRDAEYVLSIGHCQQVLHYLIQKSSDGMFHLSGMSMDKFVGPIELVESIRPSSLPCKLLIPCIKPVNVFVPGVNCGITEDRLSEALHKKATEWDIKDDEMKAMLQDKDNDVWKLVYKTLHESEGWYHGKISRSEADKRLAKSGHKNGKFLIRERDERSFSLSLSFDNQAKHYKIDVLSSGEVGIPEGPRFENIISLVSHYSVFSDGLWCLLKYACINQTSPTPTSTAAISWPMERQCSIGDISTESQPVFPPNRPNSILKAGYFLSKAFSKSNESESTKTSIAELNPKTRRDSKTTPIPEERVTLSTKKIIPLRPPPPPPNNEKPAVPLQSVIQNMPAAQNSPPILEKLPSKVPTLLDLNANAVENNPTILNASMDSASSEEASSGVVSGDVPKQKGPPVPSRRRLLNPLQIPQAENENMPTKVLNNSKEVSPRPQSRLSTSKESPASRILPSPPSLTNGSETNGISDTSNGSKSPNIVVPKPVMATSPLIFMAELKTVVNDRGKDRNISPPILPSDDKENGKLRRNSNKEPPIGVTTCLSPLQDFESLPSLKHTYVEIDPEYQARNGSPEESLVSPVVVESKWDEVEENSATNTKKFNRKPPWTKEESELHFNTIKRHRKNPATIDRRNLIIQERLGLGNFGEVSKALFKLANDEVPCAVKTLRRDQISNGKEEILREARIMTKMDFPHIVRLFGICEGDPFLLVMELAPLGPLSSYLKRNPTVPNSDILLLMIQVALGMEYLESRQFVHRDLAARNVLLVNENFAKITDFGMSKALGLHSDYYTVEPKGKLPLKWYAPECIYYFKFSSKSDVWSYGITLWEAMERGGKPYMGMTGREILTMFSDNTRLRKPDNCSPEIYNIMRKCWEYESEDRPSFAQLAVMLKEYQKAI